MPRKPAIHRPQSFGIRHTLTRTQRGYDNCWLRLRAHHLRDNPLCVECERLGIDTIATQVDHIIPFHSVDDPLRMDPANLQSLCATHHAMKTRKENRAGFPGMIHDYT